MTTDSSLCNLIIFAMKTFQKSKIAKLVGCNPNKPESAYNFIVKIIRSQIQTVFIYVDP